MGKLGNPSGTRDFGPSQMAKRNFIFETISTVFKKYGFRQLETPAFENLSVLMGKYGEEGDKLLFKILNSGDFLKKTSAQDYEAGAQQMLSKVSDRGLKYDLTVPFARYVVQNRGELTFPFKRFQIQPVWRADRPQKGRYREFYQCDADVIGTNSLICEAEIIAMIQEVFYLLKVEGYTLKINNRKILAGIAEAVGAFGKETELCVAIDKLDKIGQEKVNIELADRGFSQGAIERLGPILGLAGSTAEKLAKLKTVLATSETGVAGVEEVEKVLSYAAAMDLSTSNIELDISLARGLNYYTGAIFEIKAPETVKIGSISGGGRYDDLTGVFGLKDMSGVGISFGIDRIYDVMEELNLFPEDSQKGVEVMFVNFDEKSEAYCLPLLQVLRNNGVESEIYPDSTKMKKQMNYANKNNIQYVVLAGDNEIEEGKVTLKNMETGTQNLIAKDDLISELQQK